MAELLADCPRCGAKRTTMDVSASVVTSTSDWRKFYELFAICRHCNVSTVFAVSETNRQNSEFISRQGGPPKVVGSLNRYLKIESYISQKDAAATPSPDHLPSAIKAAFDEAATCLAVGCWNGAAAMFRLCVDLSTRGLLPENEVPGLNSKVRRNLGLRLPWLLDKGLLPESLRELSNCIKEDGNDGAHAGTLQKEDAEDLLDFTTALLERLFTEPARLKLAEERRKARRTPTEGE